MLGTNIGNYAVTAKLGEGGMGVVYRAEHALLGRRAAVKVLLPELSTQHDIVARFFNEARALTALDHPSIVEIFDFGFLPDSSAYIIMEYLDGETLGARCRRLGRIEPRRALMLVRQIAGALAVAHGGGIVHRDLKPENIFLVPDPEVPGGERIKVLDFGIAKLATPGESSRTQTGSVLGTPTYMSPEQCRAGTVDARADLYSLGCVLFEMVCGQPPFALPSAGDQIAHHLYFPPPPPRSLEPALPEAFERLILWLLQKDPSARPQTARDLIDAIDRIGLGTGNHGPAVVSPQPPTLMMPTPAPVSTPAPVPTPSPPSTPITTLSGANGTASQALPPPRRRWVVPAVAGSLIAAGIAVALIAGSGERAQPAAQPAAEPAAAPEPVRTPPAPVVTPPAPAVTPPAPAPPAVEQVKLSIESAPPGADILVGGAKVGATPFEETIDAAAGERVYTVQKPGYEPATVTLATERTGSQRVTLKKKRQAVRPGRGSGTSVGDQGVNPFE